MEAKRCDSCGTYYHDRMQSQVVLVHETKLEDNQTKTKISVTATFHPRNEPGHPRDLCSICMKEAVLETVTAFATERLHLVVMTQKELGETLAKANTEAIAEYQASLDRGQTAQGEPKLDAWRPKNEKGAE